MSSMDFLLWVRGPGFQLAIGLFLLGSLVRILEILVLGRKPELSVARGSGGRAGLVTVFRRFLPAQGMLKRAPLTHLAGYVFHIGIFLVVFFGVAHIEVIRGVFGLGWRGLPTPVIDAISVVTIGTLLLVLLARLQDPVRRLLSDPQDYLVWLLTFLPMITGYLAHQHLLLPYNTMLALHILSFELLLVLTPFTRLSHMFTLFIARWYNGAIAGRKGVQS